MWELDHKGSWVLKNWCFWTVVLEKTLESLLDRKEIQPVNPKGNQPWIFIGRTDAEAETPILCLPDAKNWLLGKDPDVGKDWRQEEKGSTEHEMVGWHHQLDGHEFEQALGVGDGQGHGNGMLQSMGLQRVGHDWQLTWTEVHSSIMSKNPYVYSLIKNTLLVEFRREKKKETLLAKKCWDFSGGPVVETPCFYCRGPDTWSEN